MLSSELIISRLIDICNIEHVTYDKKALFQISELSNGDMRNAINNLQIIFNSIILQ